MICILKPGKDPAQFLSYEPILLLAMIGKLFERILYLCEGCGHGLLHDEHFGFWTKELFATASLLR